MGKEILLLTGLGMRSFLNLNSVLHTRDPKRKRRAVLLALTGVILTLFVFAYVGAYVYALCSFGLEKLALPWLFLLTSLLLFAVGLFRTAGVLFDPKGFDILCSLPLREGTVALSRLLCCYLEDLLLSLAVLLPGIAVYGWLLHPGAGLYLRFLLCALLTPLLPLSASALFSTLIKRLAGRLRHRSLVETVLTLLLVLGILAAETVLGSKGENMSAEALVNLTATLDRQLTALYPPCGWAAAFCEGGAVESLCKLLYVNISACALVLAVTLRFFRPISQSMHSTVRRKGGAAMEGSRGLLPALFRREWKRYLASSIYVTNTAIGPLLAVIGAAALSFADISAVADLGLPLNAMAPFALSTALCMMPPAAVSLSMEGKQRWITRTLPIPPAALLDGKMLMTLSLELPCALLASLLLCSSLHPTAVDAFFLFVLPPLFCLLSANLGLCADVLLGSTEWEREVTVVKQSASSMAGGLGVMLLCVACCAASALLPAPAFRFFRLALLLLLPVLSLLLRRFNIRRMQ